MLRQGIDLSGVCFAALILAAAFAFPPTLAQAGDDVGWTHALQEAGIDGTLSGLSYPRDWTLHRTSSYDRTGGGDDDRYGQQVYDGGVVLADMEGPGTILRLFVENPWGTLAVFVDDMEHPIIVRNFEDLFTGDLELFSPSFHLFAPPFTGVASGGYYSYVPIPYSKRCRVIAFGDGEALNYQVDYATFPEGTPVKPFELTLNKDDLKFFRTWRDTWTDYDFRFHDRKTEKLHQSSTILFPHTNWLVYPIEGPGVIREIEMEIDSVDPDYTGQFWIAIYFDGQSEPGVLAPIGDFFGRTAVGAQDHSGVVLGNIDGRMWCRYPMPFREFAEIRIISTSAQSADFSYNIIWEEGPVNNQLYFNARYQSATAAAGRPIRVADITGSGHFAGATISASGARDLAIVQGDDTFRVDGRPASEFHGTGTDNFFNSGGYFASGTYSHPTHACTVKTGSVPTGFGATRSFVTDVVPFDSSFAFDLEHGTRNNQAGVQYSSVAYWYQTDKDAPKWAISELSGVKGIRR